MAFFPTASGLMIANVCSMAMFVSSPLENLLKRPADLGGAFRHANPGTSHRLLLFRRGSFPPRDDGAGVSHPAPWRGGASRDKADHRLAVVCLDPCGRFFF